MPSIRSTLRRDIRSLRNACKAAVRDDDSDAAAQWLADNYHLLHAAGTQALAQLRRPQADARLLRKCLALCPAGSLPGAQLLPQALRELHLCAADCERLPGALQAALLHRAAKGAQSHQPQLLIAAIRSLLWLREVDFTAMFSQICETERILAREDWLFFVLF